MEILRRRLSRCGFPFECYSTRAEDIYITFSSRLSKDNYTKEKSKQEEESLKIFFLTLPKIIPPLTIRL